MLDRYRQRPFTAKPRLKAAVLAVIVGYLISQPAALATSLVFASNLGGSQSDAVRAIATDAAQNIYVVGETYSQDFPGAAPSNSRSSGDAFIVKLNPTGAQILYSIVLGGSGYDSARGVAVDSAGNVYVTGTTGSPNFPTTAGAFQQSASSYGQSNAFVVKVNPAGSIVYSTYLGGASTDIGYAIAVDSTGAAYVAGSTNSTNFPVTSGAPQSHLNGATDGFVVKLDPTGATLIYATYIGGENIDLCSGIAVDGTGAAFVTGTTSSTAFPVVAALDSTLSGPSDAFLAKISSAGNSFLFSTYLGGESADNGNVVALDSSGNAYVGGNTMSTSFPVTSGVVQTTLNGSYDGFLCAIANSGSAILFATYLGGSASDSINGLFINASGQIVVAGYTASVNFPLMNPIQGTFGGDFDAFVAILGPNASSLVFATYLGGGGDDQGFGVAPLGPGQLVFAGQVMAGTVSYMQQLYYSTPAGQYDGFVAAIAYAPLRFVPLTPCRVADTRQAPGPFGGPSIASGTSRSFAIPSGACGVPSTALAYSLNITALPQGGYLGYLTVWPSGEPQPRVSLLNSWDGRIKANAAIVPAGADGAVSIFVTNTADALIDINGYFVPATDPSALAFYPLTPCRMADTRKSPGPLGGPSMTAGTSRTFPILSSTCGIPSTAQAYSLNFTAVPPAPLYVLSAWPAGLSMPRVSTLNDYTGTIVANAAIVQSGSSGSIEVYTSDNTDVLIDTNGYFAPSVSGGLSLYTVTPCRVFNSSQPPGSPPINGAINVQITGGACGIPTSARAFVLNTTVVPPGSLGYLALWPEGQPQPAVSTLNAVDGALTSNMAIIPSTNGWISAFVNDPTQLFLDIYGYFAP
jgi:Beta-propeller repeat